MNRTAQRRDGKGALEMLEEAVHLMRRAPGRAFASYYAGSVPFVLGFLYFWADMSRGAFAREHLVDAAFFLGLLFLWMKCWQTVFAGRLRDSLTGNDASPWPFRRILRMFLAQTAVQPAGILLLPLALLVTLPFGWVYAYYQNLTVYGDGTHEDVKDVTRKARDQAMLFQKQNHAVLAVLALFGIFVFLNMAGILYLAPQLVRTFSGAENAFTRASASVLNTTFLAAAAAMTYLAVDPIVKSVYALRCFYGESIVTGEDLHADLKNIRYRTKASAAAALIVLAVTCAGSPASAGEAVSAGELERSMSETISRPEYAWRMPREKKRDGQETAKGPITKFIQEAADAVIAWLGKVTGWMRKAAAWIVDQLLTRIRIDPGQRPREGGWPRSVFILLSVLLAISLSVLAVMLLRMLRAAKGRGAPEEGEVLPVPDLTREDVSADQLPTDRWLEIGSNLMKHGDERLALRAFYLASLSRLSERGRITISLFKSNREYERELGRKAHTDPDLVSAFARNVGLFERIWYGTHEVTADIVRRFMENQERIMAHGEKGI